MADVDLSREAALKILYDINERAAYSNIAINKYLRQGRDFREIDRIFVAGLVYGVIKWKLTIDQVICQFSNIPLKKLSPWILNILRLGTYQLLYTDRIPESAACNESVKLALKYGHRASANYVNAVLRNIARRHSEIKYPDREKEPVEYLSFKYSHPSWMVKHWIDLFGEDFTESLLEANNKNPDFTVRVNTLKTTRQEFMEKLDEKEIGYTVGRYIDNALIVNDAAALMDSGLFAEGYFTVQDEASMMVSKVLDPAPGELVMDVCAAPGGKSTHIAEMMGNEGMVVSWDIHVHKAELVEKAARRLSINIVKAELHDSSVVDANYIMKADRVLVDAPCTGTGIIRRKPEIKWNKTVKDKEEIRALQLRILSASAEYVKPGGVLVYSTCSIEPDENIDVVNAFLKSSAMFRMVGFEELLPPALFKESAGEGYIYLFPNVDNTDGFFIAKMKRKEG
ncbi:MAG: 16S rRNA (cytosine(967)-C(5))-methyltransferase RsmB [Clostridiaceae bacterium]|nr:16S rRNA (cytosine(967)-C(5))-methyltransferase RsmB [Clostridiaceae bacterium]